MADDQSVRAKSQGVSFALSRRGVFTGLAASPEFVKTPSGAAEDRAVDLSERWLAANAEIDCLQRAWGRCEHVLARKYNGFGLSQDERRALPEGRKLDALSAEMEALGWECDALLRALTKTSAQTLGGVIARLTVATGLIYPDDHPEAHGLVSRSLRDLKALTAKAQGRRIRGCEAIPL